jgi:hypothetical protein
VTRVGCGVVGGVDVCHLIGHGHGGAGATKLKELARNCGSHAPKHSAKGGDCSAELKEEVEASEEA